MKKLFAIKIIIFTVITLLQFFPVVVQAQEKATSTSTEQRCNTYKNQFKLSDGTNIIGTNIVYCSSTELILAIIKFVQLMAGIVTVLFLMIGGFLYVSSVGNEEQSEKGKKIIINSVIGLIVILLSYAIVRIASSLITLGS